jgi:sulfite reductase (NADPH) hemoprotein beta-component
MYRYDAFDREFVAARAAQFADQVERRLAGELSEDEFRPLRLMNGVYLQLHAYMLRVAIPYGTLNARQMRMLAQVARQYDRGYGHFTTRQNIQFNWPSLVDIPKILVDLASVDMHAIQTSGNCIRNVTTDHFAGAAADEIDDPRVHAEILRQWSTLHPEFVFLPRKFKIAITGSATDRAAIRFHDIGLALRRSAAGATGFAVYVGGGQGRTPMIGKLLRDFLPERDLIAYTEAILRVYNLNGRRDNKYKARIKILVHETGIDELRASVEAEFARIANGALRLPDEDIAAIRAHFALPPLRKAPAVSLKLAAARAADATFDRWVTTNTAPHRALGHAIVTVSLKGIGAPPGDATARQMDALADIAQRFSHDELRVSHEQNIVLPHVAFDDLRSVHGALVAEGLAADNVGLVTDIIACPGLDYCALANARAIPLAQTLSKKFADPAMQREIGPLKIKISGCINACGHHHVGHIGILGVDRKGEEYYQVTLGGSADENAAVGEIVGPGFSEAALPDAIGRIVDTYLARRNDASEPFLAAVRRLGAEPFRQALYG